MKACFSNKKYTMSIQTRTTQILVQLWHVFQPNNNDVLDMLLLCQNRTKSDTKYSVVSIPKYMYSCPRSCKREDLLYNKASLYKYIGSYLVQCT